MNSYPRREFLAMTGTGAALPFLLTSSRGGPGGSLSGKPRPVADRLGVTHTDPRYSFTDRNVLNEGAERLQELGTRVMKVWFHRCDEQYAQHSTWPTFDSPVERARHSYFRELFDRPFDTFVLSAYSEQPGVGEHYFRDGVSDEQYGTEVRQFCELTKHLLRTYDGTEKTFVLQHWEGDWAILGSYDRAEEPTDAAVQGMVQWLAARQQGVRKARREVESDVTVLHAAEVNLVRSAMTDGDRRVVNAVLPETTVDLVSYSAYDAQAEGFVPENPNEQWQGSATPPEHVALIRETLDYVAAQAPTPDDYVRERLRDGERNVYVGEYGHHEADGTKAQTHLGRVMTDVALDWGARWVIYWQLYDNEGSGFGLVRADGSTTPTYDHLQRLLATDTVPSAPAYHRLDLEFDDLCDGRAFECDDLALLKSGAADPRSFDIGTPLAEPLVWAGAFGPEADGDRTTRWFGGNGGRTTLFVRREAFADTERLRLRGRPVRPADSVAVSVDGARAAELAFDAAEWGDWEVSLS